MNIQELEISIDEIKNINLDKIFNKSQYQICVSYNDLLNEEIKQLRENSAEWKLFTLLSALTSFTFGYDSDGDAFIPFFIYGINSRSVLPCDFTDSHLDIFCEIAKNIQNSELKARIYDVLWERRYGDTSYLYAENAITSYLLAVENLFKLPKEQHIFSIERISRTLTLAKQIKYKKSSNLFSNIEAFLGQYELEDIIFIRIIEILLERKGLPSNDFLTILQDKYQENLDNGQLVLSERYCEALILWARIANDQQLLRDMRMNLANLYVLEARESADQERFITAVSLIRRAIVAFGNIDGTDEERIRLKAELLDYQSKLSKNFASHQFEVDLSDIANYYMEKIKGKTKEEAILHTALMLPITSKDNLRQQVEKTQSPIMSLISRSIVDDKGRTIANNSPVITNSEEENQQMIEEDVSSYFVNYEIGIIVNGYIKPCLYQLNIEHNIGDKDLDFIVNNNMFIPSDRKKLFTKGLLSGFKSDFLVATHILGLQIENSIRYVLNNFGVITSSLSSDGIQEEIDINRLLDIVEVHQIFGGDITFILKSLLTSRFGSNLRNNLAHALLRDDEFYSSAAVYLWWLVLYLCVYPIYTNQNNES